MVEMQQIGNHKCGEINMGYGTRTPDSNDPPQTIPEDNPWGTDDDFFHLLNKTAIRCCHCQIVVGKKHATVVNGHVFCPNHKASGCKICSKSINHQFNVKDFIEHNKTS